MTRPFPGSLLSARLNKCPQSTSNTTSLQRRRRADYRSYAGGSCASAPATAVSSVEERLQRAERRLTAAAEEVSALPRGELTGKNRTRIVSAVLAARDKLNRLLREFGLPAQRLR